MFKLLSTLLLVFLLSFAITWANPSNTPGLSFQIVALSRAVLPDGHTNNGSTYTTEDLRLPISTSAQYAYGVFVSLGTGEGTRLKVLALDTEASTSWVMCEPCHPSPPQVGNLFSPGASPTFHGVHSNDPVCTTPYRKTANGCSFHFSSITGYLSRDTFHLRTGRAGAVRESIPRVVFGCAHSSTGFHNDNTLGGVLSLSHLPLSLLTQLGAHVSGRFSYCLPKSTGHNPHGSLFLGADVPSPPPHSHTTNLVIHPGVSGYHLNLIGITLGYKRLKIDKRVFVSHSCSINPAETITHIAEPIYLVVEKALVARMKELGSDRVKGPTGGPLWFDRMYQSVKEQLPNMAFHFEGGAELWFTSDRLFEVHGMNARFMVAGRGYRRTVIGAAQQVNTRFTFDVARGKLSFVSEVCD
ncbi:hypothetical protein ZWY2020_019399 [Hordeum vulgare]|nr:hypothetical protein ZWY2020_019399 [Hordeum vulgare]